MFHQGSFSCHVALVHGSDLRHCHVGLIDDEDEVIGEKVQQGVGCRAFWPSVNVSGIVLNARARANFPHHFQVIGRSHPQALRFE